MPWKKTLKGLIAYNMSTYFFRCPNTGQRMQGLRGVRPYMSGCDEPIEGHRKFCRAKSCSSAGPPGEPLPRDRIKNLLRKMKMVPLRVVTWPKDNKIPLLSFVVLRQALQPRNRLSNDGVELGHVSTVTYRALRKG